MKKKISGKTVIYTMRIVGSLIMLAAIGLIVYLAWITSHVGIDTFLIGGFSVGLISVIVASLMIYFSFRITFEEEQEVETEIVQKKKEHIITRKCG